MGVGKVGVGKVGGGGERCKVDKLMVIWPSMTAKKALPVRGTAIVVVKQLYSGYEYSSEEGPLLRV